MTEAEKDAEKAVTSGENSGEDKKEGQPEAGLLFIEIAAGFVLSVLTGVPIIKLLVSADLNQKDEPPLPEWLISLNETLTPGPVFFSVLMIGITASASSLIFSVLSGGKISRNLLLIICALFVGGLIMFVHRVVYTGFISG